MLNPDYAIKFAFSNELSFEKIAAKGNMQERALGRIATHPIIQQKSHQWRSSHEDWKSLAAFMLSKNTGRRYKKKKNSTASVSKEQKSPVVQKIESMNSTTGTDVLKKSRSSGVWTVTKLSKSQKNEDDSSSEQSDEDKEVVVEPSVFTQNESLNNYDSDENTGGRTMMKNHASITEKTCAKMKSENSNMSKAVKKSENVPNTSREMVVTKLCLDDLSGDGDIPVLEYTKDRSVSFLFETELPPKEAKKDTFFLTGNSEQDSESFESTSEESDENAHEQEESNRISLFEEPKISKTMKSTFLETLSSEGMKQKSDAFREKERKAKRQRENDGQFEQRVKPTDKHSRMKRKEQPASISARPPGQKSAINEQGKEKLHPSWEASRKRKQQMSAIVEFKGKKTTFDDD